jgi:hypothetical protein
LKRDNFSQKHMISIWFNKTQLCRHAFKYKIQTKNVDCVFCCAWRWNKTRICQQLCTFNSHKTFHVETFVNTTLHYSKSNN